jgi:hypothetical protein
MQGNRPLGSVSGSECSQSSFLGLLSLQIGSLFSQQVNLTKEFLQISGCWWRGGFLASHNNSPE